MLLVVSQARKPLAERCQIGNTNESGCSFQKQGIPSSIRWLKAKRFLRSCEPLYSLATHHIPFSNPRTYPAQSRQYRRPCTKLCRYITLDCILNAMPISKESSSFQSLLNFAFYVFLNFVSAV